MKKIMVVGASLLLLSGCAFVRDTKATLEASKFGYNGAEGQDPKVLYESHNCFNLFMRCECVKIEHEDNGT